MPEPKARDFSWDELLHMPVTRGHFLIDPYIPRTGKVLLWGDTSVGKSPVSWHMAHCVAEGKPFCGLPTQQARVLFIEVDSTEEGTKVRLQKRPDITTHDVRFIFLSSMSIPNVNPEDVGLIIDRVKTFDPGLIIVNSLQKIHSLSPRETQTATIVYNWWNQVCGPDRAYVFVHHERKTPSNPDFYDADREKFSGSKGWLDSAQVGIQLKKWGKSPEGPHPKEIRLYHHKSQESALYKPLPLILAGDGTTITCPPAIELEQVWGYLNEPQNLSKLSTQKDKELAKLLKVSEGTAKRRRLAVESTGFPTTKWLEHDDSENE